MDYSVVFRILVGPQRKEYIVPECLLTRTSDFFKAACSREWREGR